MLRSSMARRQWSKEKGKSIGAFAAVGNLNQIKVLTKSIFSQFAERIFCNLKIDKFSE